MKSTQLPRTERTTVFQLCPDQLFAVYQPIVDRNLNLKGVELLCRRYVNGRAQLPGAFFRENITYSSWKTLTGIMLDNAVNRINEDKGYVNFTVNIPAILTVSAELVSLVICSLLRLKNLNNVGLLTLEFSENTDYKLFPQASHNVKELRDLGLNVFFDDCFSPASPAGMRLPSPDIPFSGYKIDMRAVWLAQHDFSVRRKIEKLATYCCEMKLDCIAEGIESFADVSLMSSLGVNQFQGYLISAPLKWNELAQKNEVLIK